MKGYVLYLLLGLLVCMPAATGRAADGQDAVPYEQILKNRWEMTEAQFAEYQKAIIGQQVRWSGKLTDVTANQGWFPVDSYTAQIIVAGYEPTVFCDVPRDAAIRLAKNASYSFSGTIKEIDSFLRIVVFLKDVTFE